MTILVIQCRLNSTRLPKKALLPLASKSLIAWTMDAMRCVSADRYIIATDKSSYEELSLISKEKGWECFSGSEDDVLDRFCCIIKETSADILIRATGDNPFLFVEAAKKSIENFSQKKCDYYTLTDLPHGSGVEIYNASSLLKALKLSPSRFQREHVGPALYENKESFKCVFEKAPKEWQSKDERTTVDTYDDYVVARRLVHIACGTKPCKTPIEAEKIISLSKRSIVKKNIICIPSCKKGQGTGHLRRCLNLAEKIACFIYLPLSADLPQLQFLLDEALKRGGIASWQIVRDFDMYAYDLIISDLFSTEKEEAAFFYSKAPVIAIDEGSLNTAYHDYLLDIIPSVGLLRECNEMNPALIPLPQKRRKNFPKAIKKILISLGGEDPAGLSDAAEEAFCNAKSSDEKELDVTTLRKSVPELSEKLSKYDLVVTHYGFTAFESAAAGCAVILLGTSVLHTELAKRYGFACMLPSALTPQIASQMISHPERLGCGKKLKTQLEKKRSSLASFIESLSDCSRRSCPLSASHEGKRELDKVIARDAEKTIRRCASCGLLYISFSAKKPIQYEKDYFFEDYKKQYGKTYLDDFHSIKQNGVRRAALIDAIYWKRHKRNARHSQTPALLDVGCAFGPFLAAAADTGWNSYGTDISKDAVEYVNNTLCYAAVQAKFPHVDAANNFGRSQFDALTMWYVIEHFENLDEVLRAVSEHVKFHGVFAFSTPSASGVSARYNRKAFFSKSPSDHYSLFEPSKITPILKKYGFSVVKIVNTGHHPERFPEYDNETKKNEHRLLLRSQLMNLGDTFEVYCVKTAELEGGK